MLLIFLFWSFCVQKDFLDPEGSLFVRGGPSVIPAVKKAVSIAREKGAFIVWVCFLDSYWLSGFQPF
jgi:nicotinamidase-related amidase